MMPSKVKGLALVIAVCAGGLAISIIVFASDSISIMMNGKEIESDVSPQIVESIVQYDNGKVFFESFSTRPN